MPNNQKPELIEIEKVLNKYSEAYVNYNSDLIKQVVNTQVRYCYINKDTNKLYYEDRVVRDWEERIKSANKLNIKFTTFVEVIDQIGTAAIVKMRWLSERESHTEETIDYLTLLKVNDQWLITNKVCHSQKKDESVKREKIDDQEERKKIDATIQLYKQAFEEWDWEKIKQSFHVDSRVIWSINDATEIFIGDIYNRWRPSFDQHQEEEDPWPKFEMKLENIDYTGTAAYARVKWDINRKEVVDDTTDYLTLLKFGDKWLIINKSGHTTTKKK
ncbi:MAG: nuclear transport factor 2 family protein [Promethearchaeota archaeon]